MKQDVRHCWAPLLLLSSVLLGLGFKSQMGRLLQLPNEMPAQTCSDAKENGLYYGESIPTPPPGPDPLPFPKNSPLSLRNPYQPSSLREKYLRT